MKNSIKAAALVLTLILPGLAQAQAFIDAYEQADVQQSKAQPSAYTMMAVQELASLQTLPRQQAVSFRPATYQPVVAEVNEHDQTRHDAAVRSSQSSRRISYTRYEDDARLDEGNCVYSQNNFTYSCN